MEFCSWTERAISSAGDRLQDETGIFQLFHLPRFFVDHSVYLVENSVLFATKSQHFRAESQPVVFARLREGSEDLFLWSYLNEIVERDVLTLHDGCRRRTGKKLKDAPAYPS